MISELDGVLAMLALVAAVLVWLALEIRRLHDRIAPLAESRVVRALSEV
jgi:uncharacterized membrane protein YhaH (DUF805 family)